MNGSEAILYSEAAKGFATAFATIASSVFVYWFIGYGILKVFKMAVLYIQYIDLSDLKDKVLDLEEKIDDIEKSNKIKEDATCPK